MDVFASKSASLIADLYGFPQKPPRAIHSGAVYEHIYILGRYNLSQLVQKQKKKKQFIDSVQ
jgi:hypothetical protein